MKDLIWFIVHPTKALKDACSEKSWSVFTVLVFFYFALLAVLILFVIYVFAFLSGAIASAYNRHKEEIDFGICLIGGFAALCYYFKQRKKPQKQPPAQQPDVSIEKEAAERTYKNIASVILSVFQKSASIFPLVSPVTVPDIFSPARARKEGESWFYHYAMVKNAKEVDADAVKRFLNDELTRILFDHEAHGLARNTVYVEGVEYPALVVTTVKDTGSYLEISIAVTSISVKRLLDFRHAATLNQQRKAANADDEQFI
ncbi:hypothetical protein OBV_02370 [Oscillibacter valericigenes Sjm18-20]|nr:hypothetical protein OBV_02370 [Oscillibacter valericigenes Sjm18-20]